MEKLTRKAKVQLFFELWKNGMLMSEIATKYRMTEANVLYFVKDNPLYSELRKARKSKVRANVNVNKVKREIERVSLRVATKPTTRETSMRAIENLINEFGLKMVTNAVLALDADAVVSARIKEMAIELQTSPQALDALARAREALLRTNDHMFKIAQAFQGKEGASGIAIESVTSVS